MSVVLWLRVLLGTAIAATGVVVFVRSLVQKQHDARPHAYVYPLLSLGLVVVGLVFGPGGGQFEVGPSGVKGKAESVIAFAAAVQSSAPSQLDRITKENPYGVDAYFEFVQFRVEIRSLLRTLCEDRKLTPCTGDQSENDHSFQSLIKWLKADGTLDPETTKSLNQIREYTHFAEWRSRPVPDIQKVQYVFDNAPALIAKLKEKEAQLIYGKPDASQPSSR
ncbi:MAG: hypothetical protein WCC04_20840 [Terriglobales bacterium]